MKYCKRFIVPVLLTVLLSACAPMKNAVNPYNENFKCQAGDDEGECIDTPSAYKKARYPALDETPSITTNSLQEVQGDRYKILSELLKEPKKPILQPPRILRVLLLPYKGENQELFMTRYVYVKIEDSDWILSDINEK